MTMNTKIEELRAAYVAAADAYRSTYSVTDAAVAYLVAASTYRAANDAAYRVADAAWNEYQAALKAQGGKP